MKKNEERVKECNTRQAIKVRLEELRAEKERLTKKLDQVDEPSCKSVRARLKKELQTDLAELKKLQHFTQKKTVQVVLKVKCNVHIRSFSKDHDLCEGDVYVEMKSPSGHELHSLSRYSDDLYDSGMEHRHEFKRVMPEVAEQLRKLEACEKRIWRKAVKIAEECHYSGEIEDVLCDLP